MSNFAAKKNISVMQKIVLSPENRKKLIKTFGAAAVSRALSFKFNSFMSKEIRDQAMNRYNGQLINI